VRGLGTFPSDANPRILFARIDEGAQPLATLHERLLGVARAHHIAVDTRPFVPHLTVLRVRSPRDEATVRELRRTHGEATFGSVTVTELLLKSSVLGPGGASHRVEARLPLP
jgi:RNA 2',3'-cyclic 3'-phosphodiesterase